MIYMFKCTKCKKIRHIDNAYTPKKIQRKGGSVVIKVVRNKDVDVKCCGKEMQSITVKETKKPKEEKD